MDPVKEFVRQKMADIKALDPYDRKVQIAAGASVAATVFLFLKVSQRRNFFDQVPRYLPPPESTIAESKAMAAIERCSKPSEILEIVYAETGPASEAAQTVQALWADAVAKGGDHPFIGWEEQQPDGSWVYQFDSFIESDRKFKQIAKALIGLGVAKFDICNIIGSCSATFHRLFFGVIFSGGIPGGCYTTNGTGALLHICNLCKTKVIFAEDCAQLEKYMDVADKLETVKYIIVYDDPTFAEKKGKNAFAVGQNQGIEVLSFNEFLRFADTDEEKLDAELAARIESTDARQCAVVLYTSGTTGGSKGCMLSHDNLVFTMAANNGTILTTGVEYPAHLRTLSYLPLSHIAGQALSWWNPIYVTAKGISLATTYYCRKDWKKSMGQSMKACQPTFFVSVPRMYEKVYEKMIAGLINASIIKKALFSFVTWIGRSNYVNTQAGGSGAIPHLWPFVSDKLCDKRIKMGIGYGKCNLFVSGGAPLAGKVRELFASLNMPVTDCYGLSETAGAMCASRMNNFVPDAVGPSLIGGELIIENRSTRDANGRGEICYRGRQSMMGYIHQIEKTRAAFDGEGFFHSGDVGYIDEYDCLHITGRIKELLVTAGGENIAPVPVEEYLKLQCPALSQAIMVGDKQKYCAIVVSVACEADDEGLPTSELQAHAKAVNGKVSTVEETMDDAVWHAYIRKGIEAYNNDESICVSKACRIQYFQILHKDLSVQDGTMSASMKIKRHAMHGVYKKEMDALYADQPSVAVKPRM